MRAIRHTKTLLICVTLTACASYPDLYAPPSLPGEETATGVAQVMADARQAMRDYAKDYKTTARTIDYTNLPLIGAAAGAVAALFYGAHNDLLAGIGIGAGTYAAARTVLLPGGLPELYIDGYSAARCLTAHGNLFVGEVADRRVQQFREHVQGLQALADRGRETLPRARLSDGASPAQRERFQAALTELSQATANAAPVLTTAAAELVAYDVAGPTFRDVLAQIHARVAKRARSGRAIGFTEARASISGLVTGLVQPVQEAEPEAAELMEIPDLGDEALILELRRLAAEIATASANLSANMPGYASALNTAAACSHLVV